MRVELMKQKKTKDWTRHELAKSIKDLKRNKTRDPHGLLNEIIKEEYAGTNLKEVFSNL